ncbi:hypothetical protein D9M69_225240 [compost metagenome]
MRCGHSLIHLPALALACLLAGEGAQAASLPEVRYRLHVDPQADVMDDLRALAARGDATAQLMLADRLAASADEDGIQQALALYKRAFDAGRGQLAALNGLARLSLRNPQRHGTERAFFTRALQQYPHDRDFASLTATLEVFLAYPDEFEADRVAYLVGLYERACVESCIVPSYRAALADKRGQAAQAESYYRRAMLSDARAVDRYYRFLGERQDEVFKAYAATLEPGMQALPVEVVQAIGSQLSSIATENDAAVALWLDNAIARGAPSAMISKVSFMMAFADSYSPEDTLALIDRIEASQPQQGKALRASAHMVRNWRTLDPYKSYELIQELLAEGYENAYLTLGELYSMGGLDEVDQVKAIETYKRLADRGSPSAFYRIATIYGRGRGICNDKILAYAYARIAMDYGELGASKYLHELEAEISREDIAKALQARTDIIKDVKVPL